ncbi:MAG: pseudouridine synthase [Parachlamydiaceae bacterium]
MAKNRLSKLLVSAGVASRRACETLIFAGRVKVNGVVTLLPQTMVDWNDKILVDDAAIVEPESKVYFILNKPEGYICTARSNTKAKLVLDLLDDVKERLFTVGRLDKDTKGLIIITNDGHFANKVIHPSSNIVKEYLAKTSSEISDEHLKAISSGTLVEGVFVKPTHVTKVRKGTVKIAVKEGKKREVRLLLENAGLYVRELTRIRIGGLHLGSLSEGSYRELTKQERQIIFE